MRVAELMSVNVVTCSRSTSVGDAARQMVAAGVGSVLVCDEGRLVGMLTERDVLRLVAGRRPTESVLAGEVMTPDVITVESDAPAAEVAALMNSHKVRHLPIVDGATPVGIVSLRDFFVAFGSSLQRTA